MGKRSRLRTQSVKRRRLLLLGPVLVALAAGSIWFLIDHNPHLTARIETILLARKAASEHQDLPVVRGTIFDRNYKELAVTFERVSVYANIREIKVLGETIEALAEVLGQSPKTFYDRLGGASLRAWLAQDISQQQEEQIRNLDLPGVFLHKEYVRYHPQRESAAHLLGFVEKDTGLSGVEYFLNQLQTKHRINQNLPEKQLPEDSGIPDADGRHLILTLDLKIQQVLDRYLEKFSDRPPGFKVGALVMETGSGALVGYSQIPSFDPNKFHSYPEPVFLDIFDETIAVPDQFKVFLRDVSLLESQSDRNRAPLPWSIAAENRKLGVQLQLWERLGAGSAGSYDFISSPGEVSKRIAHDASGLGNRDVETVPVMQTPLQLLTAVARSINGGRKIVPHASDRYVLRRNQSEFLLDDLEPGVRGDLLNEGVSTEAQRLIAAQAVPAPLASTVMAGAGTSYRRSENGWSFARHELAMALVPAQNPEMIVLLVASMPGFGPEQRDYQGLVADLQNLVTPVAALQKVMKNLADMMSPRPREEMNFRQEASEAQAEVAAVAAGKTEKAAAGMLMPGLQGLSLRKSLRLLQGAPVLIDVEGTGRIVSQLPPQGAALTDGMRVLLVLERDQTITDLHMAQVESEK